MKPVSVLVLMAALTLVPCGVAQSTTRISVDLSTADALGVRANRQSDAVRMDTAILQPLVLNAMATTTAVADSRAARDVLQTPRGPAPGARFMWRARAGDGESAATIGGVPLADGEQHYRLVLAHATPLQGRLLMHFGGQAHGAANATALVATAANAQRFAVNGQAQQAVFPGITIGPRGLVVDVRVRGLASGNSRATAAFAADLAVHFLPDPIAPNCTVTPGVRSCPEGGVLSAPRIGTASNGLAMVTNLSGGLPNAIGLTFVSPTGATFPINGTVGCVLLQNAILHDFFQTDANGDAQTGIRFPARAGLQFSVQQGTLQITPRGIRLATSNTLDVTCN